MGSGAGLGGQTAQSRRCRVTTPPGLAGAITSSPKSLGQTEVRPVPYPWSPGLSPQEAQSAVRPPGVSCPLRALRPIGGPRGEEGERPHVWIGL